MLQYMPRTVCTRKLYVLLTLAEKFGKEFKHTFHTLLIKTIKSIYNIIKPYTCNF